MTGTDKVVNNIGKSDSLCTDKNTTVNMESCNEKHIVSGYTGGHTDTILTRSKVVNKTGKSDSSGFNKNTTVDVECCTENHITSGYTGGHTDTILTSTEKSC